MFYKFRQGRCMVHILVQMKLPRLYNTPSFIQNCDWQLPFPRHRSPIEYLNSHSGSQPPAQSYPISTALPLMVYLMHSSISSIALYPLPQQYPTPSTTSSLPHPPPHHSRDPTNCPLLPPPYRPPSYRSQHQSPDQNVPGNALAVRLHPPRHLGVPLRRGSTWLGSASLWSSGSRRAARW